MKQKAIPYIQNISISTDDRGLFVPLIQNLSNVLPPIIRVYYVLNFASGTIRGFHYHKYEWKYFFVVNGVAKVIALDPKKSKKKYIYTCSDKSHQLVVIPPGYANGWMSLAPNTLLLCASSLTFEESIADDRRYDPHKWGDSWSVANR